MSALDPNRWIPAPGDFDEEFTEEDWHEAHIHLGYEDPNCSICRVHIEQHARSKSGKQ